MERIRSLIQQLSGMNLAHSLTLALVAKALIFDISYATFLISIPVLGYEAYQLYLKSKAPDPVKINAEIQVQLDAIKSKLNADVVQKSVQQTMPPKMRW